MIPTIAVLAARGCPPALTAGANHRVQVEITAGDATRTVDLVWPLSC